MNYNWKLLYFIHGLLKYLIKHKIEYCCETNICIDFLAKHYLYMRLSFFLIVTIVLIGCDSKEVVKPTPNKSVYYKEVEMTLDSVSSYLDSALLYYDAPTTNRSFEIYLDKMMLVRSNYSELVDSLYKAKLDKELSPEHYESLIDSISVMVEHKLSERLSKVDSLNKLKK